MRAGDTIYAPPGEWHWHGATADDFMAHLSIWEGLHEGEAGVESTWGEHVTDAEYRLGQQVNRGGVRAG